MNLSPAVLPSALLIALALDHRFGEPPARLHPVVGMGRYLGWAGRDLPALAAGPAFLAGMGVWLAGAVLVGVPAWLLEAALRQAATPNGLVGQALMALLLGVALKPMLAWRMLRDEVHAVERALATGLDAGRAQVARLASRDTRTLDATQVRETAIETLAENLNDSVIAPLFWFAVAGLPGAVLYRYANTADAMWGYRGRYEWAGKWAARADDLLSWLPARLTAALLWPTLAPSDWRALRVEAARTPSPNGGWAMGAMALRLNVRLSKPGIYLLNPAGAVPGESHVARALQVASQAATAAVAGATLLWCVRSLWS